ncbi:MAG: hypothetical protein WAV53_08700, partial [Anaerolineae bacterium]
SDHKETWLFTKSARIVAQRGAAVNPKLRAFWQAASGDNIVTGGRGPASGAIAQRRGQAPGEQLRLEL